MTGKSHLIIGIASGLMLSHIVQPQTAIIAAGMVGACALGSLLPDIDSPESTINRLFPPFLVLTLFFKHRGILHSVFVPIVFLVLSLFFVPANYQVFLDALALGYLSHLIADSLTIQGIPLLSPMPWVIHLLPKPLRLTTGGTIENLLILAIIIVIILAILQTNRLLIDSLLQAVYNVYR